MKTDRETNRKARGEKFIARMIAIRNDPARCPRCGGARGERWKNCDKCRAKIKQANLRSKGYAISPAGLGLTIQDLAGMVVRSLI